MTGPSRRELLAGMVGAAVIAASARSAAIASPAKLEVGRALPAWTPGTLDIHHLAYGRGDATLVICPDGQSLLIDAGAVLGNDPALVRPASGADQDAGAWIARYVRRHIAATGLDGLNHAIVTHLHQDHIGQVPSGAVLRQTATHQQTGISAVAAHLDIDRLLDPDWPNYGYPAFEGRESVENYIAFARDRAHAGRAVKRLEAGRAVASGSADSAAWSLRTVASRGQVWTGEGSTTRDVFPARNKLLRGDWPGENAMSAAFLLSYGPFRYFTGGDLTDWADAGTRPWMNALTPAATAAGPVHVSTVPHHGMFDAASSGTIAALAARDWVISAWHASHPSLSTLERLFNPRIYPGPRDIYSTALHPAATLSMQRLTDRLASKVGHIVCRVEPKGGQYRIIVTDRDDPADRIVSVSDPRSTMASADRAGPRPIGSK
ncbi:ComEC/Rec2 family competence protein [Erythrobacter sp. HL-111]|uniref:ComEC/Rec2 family competence protein n=1 Tax=Erythrobacter sp. HL-111 TaxID=1798193 RepID=UPI0006DB8EF8|nr:hypothetical protein [Erythrobacter sp. HL-111]KPP94454.1 MAG: beta-lactamase superfamily metal-dependent hydrolase [Erythrobacteraceae bacterium HL-111]SDS57876.1 Metal-dependent hydrolase, beta-lactamase superfamily II [Erythrobacter sp. HL-111]